MKSTSPTVGEHFSAPASPRTHTTPRTPARRFLDSLYGTQRGYAELSYIDGDPRYKALSRYKKVGYFAWPAQASDLETSITHYTAQGFNVYVSSSLYEKRNRESPLPSCVVFLDDAPAAPVLPYSMAVQTSAASQHAYYLLDTLISPDERRDLQRRAATANSSDTSGADVEQVVRVPGTINTKAHGRFPVAFINADGPRYAAERLRALWPAVTPTARQRLARDASLSTDSDLWQRAALHLANIDALLASSRVKAIRVTTQAARILADEMLTFIVEGNADDSRSMNGCALAHGLCAYGFPNDEIAAIVYHKYTSWRLVAEKGSAWAQVDIEACITHALAQYPHIVASATRYSAALAAAPIPDVAPIPRSRARSDRPTKIADTSDLLQQLAPLQDTPGKICKDRKELAVALGVCAKTLDRKLAPLIESGAAEWVFYNQRQESYLRLSDALEMLSTRSETPAAPAAIVAQMDVWTGEGSNRTTMRDVPSDVMEGTHAPPLASVVPGAALAATFVASDDATTPAMLGNEAAPPAPAGDGGGVCPLQTQPQQQRPALVEAVSIAYDALTSVEVEKVDRKTGEIRSIRARVTWQRLQAALADMGYSVTDKYAKNLLADERKRRFGWEAKREAFKALSDADLLKTVRAKLKTLTRYAGTPGEAYHRTCFEIADDVRQRRGLEMPQDMPKQKRARGVAPALAGRVASPVMALESPVANNSTQLALEMPANVETPKIARPLHEWFTPAEYAEAARTMGERTRQRLAEQNARSAQPTADTATLEMYIAAPVHAAPAAQW